MKIKAFAIVYGGKFFYAEKTRKKAQNFVRVENKLVGERICKIVPCEIKLLK